MDKWQSLTQDQWVLDAVSGYCIHFDSEPFQEKIPREIPFSGEQWSLVDKEVKQLLDKGAIVHSGHENGEYISTIFIVPKPNGKFRPVINLKYLNEYVHYDHFKQETFKVVLELLQQNDFLTSVDLQDAYFSIPIHKDYQKYLKFSWNGSLYQFVCLPFGLKSAPFVFTKVLKPVYAWFRQQNIRCSYYIDDSLNMNQGKEVCSKNTGTIIDKLSDLGYVVNKKKSVLIPTQRIIFFGFLIDSVQFRVYLTDEKIQKIWNLATLLMKKGVVIVRQLASFIGSIINAFYAVLEGPLHYRNLERNKIMGLGSNYNFDNTVTLSESSIKELEWWVCNIVKKNGKRIRPDKVDVYCRTDASLKGWGAIDLKSDEFAHARWSGEEAEHSINFLELKAIYYGFLTLYVNRRDIHIQVQSDNISAVAYVNDMGGMASRSMDQLSVQLWEWCLDRNIFISAIYIPGIMNTADFYSRNFSDSTEWMLKKDIFQRICRHFFHPDIDLFASRYNNQTDCFVSWFPEPGATAYNAFSIDWGQYRPYMFPPFNLISKVINKVVKDKVEKAILIFPLWKSQSWFPLLLENICCLPVRLPRHKDLLQMPQDGKEHPLAKKMKIIAVVVSGKRCNVKAFHQTLQTLSSVPGGAGQGSSTCVHGDSGTFGTISGFLVPLKQLKR